MPRATDQIDAAGTATKRVPSSASRRAVFAGGVALACASVGAAAMPHPDAELIAACERFEALEWQYLRLFHGPRPDRG